ncbi:hypothetical protein BZA70DRAFT_81081 [Myxozyma melibiosi]|uniref:Midasin n=1 Tax=Myxozyma melibiosi TaxID=54550 RepID=A0ABR1EZV0_9ASCO
MSTRFYLNLDLALERLDVLLSGDSKSNLELSQLVVGDSTIDLDALADRALDPKYTQAVLCAFYPLFPDLSARWLSSARDSSVVAQAFARVLPLIPHIASHAIAFFEHHSWSAKDSLEDLIALYRLLEFDFLVYGSSVDLKSIANVIDSTSSDAARYLAVRIWTMHLGISDQERHRLVEQHLGGIQHELFGDYEGSSNVDFFFFELWEAKRIAYYKKSIAENIDLSPSPNAIYFDDSQLSARTANLCGLLVPRHKPLESPPLSIVLTETTIYNVRSLASALRAMNPLLVTGPPGCGKTFLSDYILSALSRSTKDVVKLHLGDQTDTKLLIGTYTTGETPGSFVWKEGILVNAVREGKVIVIEDIDKAPNEVISILLSLVQQRRIIIPSRGESIQAGHTFQMIATASELESSVSKDFIGRELWHHVRLRMFTDPELEQLLTVQFPRLVQLARLMRDVYVRTRDTYKDHRFLALTRGAQNRIFSTRDLMKWARRVDLVLSEVRTSDSSSSTNEIASSTYECVLFEAIDCFAGSIRVAEARDLIAGVIGSAMNIDPHVLSHYINAYVPPFENSGPEVVVGRVRLQKSLAARKRRELAPSLFAYTKHTLKHLEKISTCVKLKEPLLLVGETGTGKTTIVQQLASSIGSKLVVINLSQQTDTSDLLGGFKPVDARSVAIPLREEFETLFEATFSAKKNEKFNKVFSKCFARKQWVHVIRLWKESVKTAMKTIAMQTDSSENAESGDGKPTKRRRINGVNGRDLVSSWSVFSQKVQQFEAQQENLKNSFVYRFIEGALVRAVRNGEWVLLDEINLATPDTLESITDLLATDSEGACIRLSEKGDMEPVMAHPNFRLFACMNPATDVGKRDLPAGFRARFTEVFVESPDQDRDDLLAIVEKYIGQLAVGRDNEGACSDVAQLYFEAKTLAESHQIVDGANQKPHFSIRTLSRTLLYVRDISPTFGLRRALYEGFCMSFLTLLDKPSEDLLVPIIIKYTIGRLSNPRSVLKKMPPKPDEGEYVQFKHYWIEMGPSEVDEQAHYIVTPFVEKNLLNLVRATATRRFPLLIQGPTSSGKTSMIGYLAKKTGHKLVRINNHEHTDLQEYLGTYVADDQGRLHFQEGALVEAARNGHWIVLDELNLAPTDVLEALNRLLDDNHEIFIPETQEVVKPHPHFLLFATQNPPGLYGGRKNLSRAFRNRFLELHFDDIPEDELETILKGRCEIAPSYAKRIVQVYKALSTQRQSTRLFEKNGFATLRDLFRWANRPAVGYEELARNGYLLLGERVRSDEEQQIVKSVIEKIMRVSLDIDELYRLDGSNLDSESGIVWNYAMRRLYTLASEAIKNNEPVLLVGETGCGKTSICQVLAKEYGKALHIVNAHQNTEASDIIGAQRPLRNRGELQNMLVEHIRNVLGPQAAELTSIADLIDAFESFAKDGNASPETVQTVGNLRNKLNVLFEWHDGALVQALKTGNFFLLDEISLTDDSVLERLNSVLEPERSILLAEKGSHESLITAQDGFQFLATMNPSGDYGKKELSPALRNRFTEIWVPAITNVDDVYQIVESKMQPSEVKFFGRPMVEFSVWFSETYNTSIGTQAIVSLRDILAWIAFVNTVKDKSPEVRLLHGACMVYIDTLGTNNYAYLSESAELLARERMRCVEYLSSIASVDLRPIYTSAVQVAVLDDRIGFGEFELEKRVPSDGKSTQVEFSFKAPTTAFNAMRIIRGMQLKKPIMLEGSPGVGKTSIMTALAAAANVELTRINLSDQTDLMDLFGADSPAEGARSGEFVWRDAPFLHAMKNGYWVLLDEMNLASQSVLEGLNACLDHRGEAYIPELDRTFVQHPNFRVFAAQNPHYQGGGRKGLPKSFINRFTVVYVDLLTPFDLKIITNQLFPSIDESLAQSLVQFVSSLEREVSVKRSFGRLGAPWEFNLRDTLRWFQLLIEADRRKCRWTADEFLDIIVKQRFRTKEDRQEVTLLYENQFSVKLAQRHLSLVLSDNYLQVGHAILERKKLLSGYKLPDNKLVALQCNMEPLESLMTCVDMAWPAIIVGPTRSGKSSLIRLLASLVGADLEEFSINSDIDSMDIVGGYEQVDATRRMSLLWSQISETARSVLAKCGRGEVPVTAKPTAIALYEKTFTADHSSVSDLLEAAHIAGLLADTVGGQLSSVLRELVVAVENLQAYLSNMGKQAAAFEWFDGTLVRAMEAGKWLVLDNANLCGPSVLDRLNSLLEPNGVLAINEQGLEDGKLRIVKPHPGFRLFLTVDPRHGELSRAMRNRGIEIYLSDLEQRATSWDLQVLSTSADTHGRLLNESDELSLDLKDLTLMNKSSKHMAINELPVDMADMRVYGLLDSVEISKEPKAERELAVAAIAHLPISLLSTVSRWSKALNYFEFYAESETSFAHSIAAIYSEFATFPYAAEVLGAYKSVAIENYESFQSFYPSSNPHGIYWFENPLTDCEKSLISLLYEATFAAMDLESCLSATTSRAKTLRASKLNYLERSAAASYKRSSSADYSSHLFEVVSATIQLISKFVRSASLQTAQSETVHVSSEILKTLRGVIALAQHAQVDESQFPIFHDIFDAYALRIEEIGDPFIQSSEWNNWKIALDAFTKRLSLVSGKSMEIIWSKLRPAVPKSYETWDLYSQLLSCSHKLDEATKDMDMDGLEELIGLQRRIFAAADILLYDGSQSTSTIENLLMDCASFLSSLPQTQLKKGNKSAWRRILGYVLASKSLKASATIGGNSIDLKLANLSGISLSVGIDCIRSKTMSGKNFLDFLHLFSSLDDFSLSVSELFGGKVLQEFIMKLDSAEYGRIRDVIEIRKELSVYGKEVAGNANIISLSKLKWLMAGLIEHMRNMLLAHIPEEVRPLVGDQESASTISDAELASLVQIHAPDASVLLQCVEEAHQINDEIDSYPQQRVGALFIRYASLLLHLYIPNVPHDPAIKPYVKAYFLTEQRSEVSSQLRAVQIVERAFVGDEKSIREAELEQQLSSLEVEGFEPTCYRPEVSQSKAFFQEISRFLQGYATPDKANELWGDISAGNERSKNVSEMFHRISSQFIERLKSQFKYYTDLFDPVVEFVTMMRLGVGLVSDISISASNTDFSAFTWLVDSSLFGSDRVASISDILQTVKSLNFSQRLSSKVTTTLIQWLQIRYSYTSERDTTILSGIGQIFKQLYYNWSLNKSRLEAEQMAKTTVYKANDDEDDDEEFKSMFPDYEDFVSVESVETKFDEESFTQEVCSAFLALFDQMAANPSVQSTVRKSFSLLNEIDFSMLSFKDSDIRTTISSVVLEFSQVFDDVSGTGSAKLNFYTSSSALESEKAVRIFLTLRVRLVQLVERWPENEILGDCLRFCDDFLDLPTTVPVARMLIYVEKQLGVLHEWQKVASREFSVTDHIDILSKLVIEWRKFELSTWASLFDEEVAKAENGIAKWFFYLYENAIAIPVRLCADNERISDHVLELAQAVTAFIGSSPKGQFEKRLKLVRAFSLYSFTFPGLSQVGEALRAVDRLYSQFVPIVAKSIASQRKVLEKEVTETVLLASWKDTNFIALKESARRSHHKLYKSIRKFREVLDQPVRPLIDGGLESLEAKSTPSATSLASGVSLDQELLERSLHICLGISSWSERPERLTAIVPTISRIRGFVSDCITLEIPSLAEYADGLVDEMQKLRKETPAVLNEETKHAVQFLKARKTKLLSETLKELKAMGLRFRARADVVERQDTVVKILRGTKVLDGLLPSDTQDWFFRVLEFMPRVRSLTSNHSEELTPGQIQRGLGISENLLNVLLMQRDGLYTAKTAQESFTSRYLEFVSLRTVSKSEPLHEFDIRGQMMPDLLRKIKLSRAVMNVASSAAVAHAKFCEDSDDKVLQSLTKWTSRLATLIEILESVTVPSTLCVINSTSNGILQTIKTDLESCDAEFSELSDSRESYAYILLGVRSFFAEEFSNWGSVTSTRQELADIESLELALRSLSDSILVVVQEVRQLMSEPISVDDEDWIPKMMQCTTKVLQKLHIGNVSKAIEKSLDVVNSLDIKSSESIGALFSITAPFVDEYRSFMDQVLIKFATQHNEMSQSGLTLLKAFNTVATNGYCSPQEPSDKEESSNLQQGTGLGDGDGEQNISNTVGDDEDLSDLANQPDDKKEKDDGADREEQDNAVDIDGDMEGDLEDVDQSGDENESGSDGEQSEEEMDEEVGEVDDLDPTAVDEKMWNDDVKDETSNDKSTDQQLQDTTTMDDLAANQDEQDAPTDNNQDKENDDAADEQDMDDDAEEEEEGAMDQEDAVQNDDKQMESTAPEGDALDLPEDMNLDNEEEGEGGEEKDDDDEYPPEEDPLDSKMDIEEMPNSKDEPADDDEGQEKIPDVPDPEAMDVDEENEEEEAKGDIEGGDGDSGSDDDMNGDEEEMDVEDEGENQVTDGVDQEVTEGEEAKTEEEIAISQSEGAHGPEESKADEEENEAASKGAADGSKDSGRDSGAQDATEESASKEGGAASKDLPTQDVSSKDEKNENTGEAQRQLGDAKEEFHRSAKEIEDVADAEIEKDVDSKQENAESYRHLEENEASHDTQALGMASNDQQQTIDEEMAVDDEVEKTEDLAEAIDDATDNANETADDDGETKRTVTGGIIGERKPAVDEMEVDNMTKQEFEHEINEEETPVTAAIQVVDSKDTPYRSLDEARDVWQQHERTTGDLSNALCEQLRLILEPTQSTKLRGDFRSGKRLNMKRIIPYIASEFKKDKIWLRRTKPSKREYQIMISLDDSKSMSESKSVNLAFDTLTLVSKALERLEAGQVSIVRFGEQCEVVHPFQKPFTSEAGAHAFQWFGFAQTRTNMYSLVENSISLFDEARVDSAKGDMWQLEIIISDGVCEDHEKLRQLVRRAREQKIMMVFIIVDGLTKGGNSDTASSILDLKQVKYYPDEDGTQKMKMTKYLDTFPFEFYVIVRNIAELPAVLSLVLRQYFSEVADLA